jgi:dethiobiotin synthetase
MSKSFVITGTDTDIGKTVFAAALTQALGGCYWKPVQAGLDGGGDCATVRDLARLPPDRIVPEVYRLTTACSPHRAAELDNVEIDLGLLTVPSPNLSLEGARGLIIEGAGGALVPLTRNLLFADLFARWKTPVIIVARTSLGTINHSLMTIEALRSRSVPIHGIAFIGDANADSEATICAIGRVKRLGRLPILSPLTPATLAKAFAENFALSDFT